MALIVTIFCCKVVKYGLWLLHLIVKIVCITYWFTFQAIDSIPDGSDRFSERIQKAYERIKEAREFVPEEPEYITLDDDDE